MNKFEVKFKRSDYIGNLPDGAVRATHRQYYGQFVTPEIKNLVLRRIASVEQLVKAAQADRHLNNIPLQQWDNVRVFSSTAKALEQAGDYLTLCGQVCILKEAALQIVEENSDLIFGE